MSRGRLPVLMVSGDHDFLRTRCVQGFRREAERHGAEIKDVALEDLDSALSPPMFMVQESPVFVVVETKGEIDQDLVMDHQKDGDSNTKLLVVCLGQPRAKSDFAKLVKKLPKGAYQEFVKPPPYKADEEAANFCIAEAKRGGKGLTTPLATAMVARVGSDLGFLSQEVRKCVVLAEARGDENITTQHVKETMALIAEASVWPFIRALGKRSIPATLKALARIRQTSPASGDPTMKVVGLARTEVLRWLQAANLNQRGVGAEEAAAKLGLNPWRYKNQILPISSAWGEKSLLKLVRVLAETEASVKKGALDPWTFLETGVIEVLSSFQRVT